MDKPLCAKLSLMLVPLMNPESFTSDGVPHRELGKVMDIDGLIFWFYSPKWQEHVRCCTGREHEQLVNDTSFCCYCLSNSTTLYLKSLT